MRLTRQEVDPERRFSARWWPVEDEFQGSKILERSGGLVVWAFEEVVGVGIIPWFLWKGNRRSG